MDEKRKEAIKQDAKKILDKFSKSLENVKSSNEWNVEREKDRRVEGEGLGCDKDFRKIMLSNSENHDEDAIFAEKKSW